MTGTRRPTSTGSAQEPVAIHRAVDEGPAVWAVGTLYQIKLRASESAGQLTVMKVTSRPGAASPLHVHSWDSDAFYLIDGEMVCRLGDDTYRLGPGSFIHLPPRVPHAFRVVGDRVAQVLDLAFPGGIEGLFERAGGPAAELCLPATATPEEMDRWRRAAPDFGIEVLGPPIPA